MRFNNLWITFRTTMSFLMNFNKRVKQLDERVKALDARVITIEESLLMAPGTDAHNDFDMAADITKTASKVNGLIE